MRQPYGRAIASTVRYAHPRWYAAQGFVVAVQDVRGRGDSEGEFGGFAQEARDGRAAVRWLRSLPECNGWVGTYGFSYQGLSQLLIGAAPAEGEAGLTPQDLPDALAPAMCGLDERLHWAAEGGAHGWALLVGWGLQLAAEGCRRRGNADGWLEIRRSLETGDWPRQGAALLTRHDPDGMVMGWLGLDPAEAAGWQQHEPTADLLRRPMLLIGGWHDPHLRGVLDLWRRSRAAGGAPELVIGAWTHLDWEEGIDERQLAFFRRHLGGASNGAPIPAPHLQCMTSGGWRQIETPWAEAPEPPAGPATAIWSLHSEGLAAVRSSEGTLRPLPSEPQVSQDGGGRLSLVHDPWRPVPGRGGHLGLDAGICERGDIDRRADVACFTGQPLVEPLELLGEPWLEIVAAADQPGFDLCAALSVLGPENGPVRQLCTGVLRQRGEGCRVAAPRRLRLQPLRARLQAGERLRLSLAGAAWPQIAVNPGDGSLPRGASGPGHRVIELRLDLAGSRLWLNPLLGAD
jgi:putative CocE/NonD family hydrolase